MRFWIVLAALVVLAFLAFRSCSNGGGLISGAMDSVTSAVAGTQEPPEPSPAPSGSPSAPSLSQTRPSPGLPVVTPAAAPQEVIFSRVFTFENVIPSGESLALLSTLNVSLATQPNSPVVLVRGPADDVAAACDFLAAIDRPQSSCTVQTWAVYVSKRMQTGWDLAGAIGSVLDAPNMLIVSPGAVTLNVSGDQITAALNILADGSNVEVLQRPHVSLIHGVPAKIESIQEVPVPQTTVSQGISQTSISYRKVGLQLEVVPTFLSPGRLRLAVSQTNGIIGQNVNIAGNDVPIIQSQTVSTTAEVLVGQTVILGGVTTQRVRETKGILRNTREVEEGSLYLIMSTSIEIPRAIPVLEDPTPPAAPLLQDEFSSGVLPSRVAPGDLPLPVK